MTTIASEHFDRQYQTHLKHLKLKGLLPKTIEAYSRSIRRVGDYFDHQIDDLTVGVNAARPINFSLGSLLADFPKQKTSSDTINSDACSIHCCARLAEIPPGEPQRSRIRTHFCSLERTRQVRVVMG